MTAVSRRPAFSPGIVIILLPAIMVFVASAREALPVSDPPPADSCAAPSEFVTTTALLPHTRAQYKAGQPIRIVALGTSSTAGTGAANRDEAYPAKLQSELPRLLPGANVVVINQGVGGQSARRMVTRIEDDVVAHKPKLVIWQTGTVEAVNNIDLEEFGFDLSQGIEILHKEEIDVVLMNMQYSRRLELLINYERYDDMIKDIAAHFGVAVFDRLGIMKHWADNGQFDYDNVPRGERRKLAAKVHSCLGRQLAEMIAQAIR